MTDEQIKELRTLVQIASNLIADDLTDCTEENAPEHFAFLRRATAILAATYKRDSDDPEPDDPAPHMPTGLID